MGPAPSTWKARSARLARCAASACLIAAAAATSLGAQDFVCDPGDQEIWGLHFEGNRTFDDATLANGLLTEPTSALRRWVRVLGDKRCLDKLELSRDSLRLIAFHRRHGFPRVRVGTRIVEPRADRVDITFTIDEGAPLLVDSLAIVGLDSLPLPNRVRLVRSLPIKPRDRFDGILIDATRDTLEQRLRNEGYALAEVLRSFESDTIAKRNEITYTVLPGPRLRIGEVQVNVDAETEGERQRINPTKSRAAGRYRARRSIPSKRSECRDAQPLPHRRVPPRRHLDRYHVDQAAGGHGGALGSEPGGESPHPPARLGRLGDARLLPFTGILHEPQFPRASAAPRGQRAHVEDRKWCAISSPARSARNSPMTSSATRSTARIRSRSHRERCSACARSRADALQRAYGRSIRRISAAPIGAAGHVAIPPPSGYPLAFGYQIERGRTEAQPALFCAVFSICEDEARRTLLGLRWQAVASGVITRDRVDNIANPANGSLARLELRHASRAIGSDPRIQFNRGVFDAAAYRRIDPAIILAGRVRLGSVIGGQIQVDGESRRAFIPPQERLYAGGAGTVRGFQQNELGPVVYRIDPRTIDPCLGGHALLRGGRCATRGTRRTVRWRQCRRSLGRAPSRIAIPHQLFAIRRVRRCGRRVERAAREAARELSGPPGHAGSGSSHLHAGWPRSPRCRVQPVRPAGGRGVRIARQSGG